MQHQAIVRKARILEGLQSKGLVVWLVMQAIPFHPGQPLHFQEKNTTRYHFSD